MKKILYSQVFFIVLFSQIIKAGQVMNKEKQYGRRIGTIKNIAQFVQMYPSTKVVRCTHNYKFNYRPFPLRMIYGYHLWHPSGIFQDISILEVNNGLVYI